jgi:hypothetical protein
MSLSTIYVSVTLLLFAWTVYDQLQHSLGYFSGALAYMSEQGYVFILYNAVLSVAMWAFVMCVRLFFERSMEGEVEKIVERLKTKLLDIVFFAYVIELRFGLGVYSVLVLLVFLHVLHEHLIFRAEYVPVPRFSWSTSTPLPLPWDCTSALSPSSCCCSSWTTRCSNSAQPISCQFRMRVRLSSYTTCSPLLPLWLSPSSNSQSISTRSTVSRM